MEFDNTSGTLQKDEDILIHSEKQSGNKGLKGVATVLIAGLTLPLKFDVEKNIFSKNKQYIRVYDKEKSSKWTVTDNTSTKNLAVNAGYTFRISGGGVDDPSIRNIWMRIYGEFVLGG